jgi:hypothetical protein
MLKSHLLRLSQSSSEDSSLLLNELQSTILPTLQPLDKLPQELFVFPSTTLLPVLKILFPILPLKLTFDHFWPLISKELSYISSTCHSAALEVTGLLLQLPQARIELLSKLASEDENQTLKQSIETAVMDFSFHSMQDFCDSISFLALRSSHRLSLFVLLTRLLRRDHVPVYLILSSPLLAIILESCRKDTHPVGLKASIALLTLLMPFMSQSLSIHFHKIMLVFIRLICWESQFLKLDQDSPSEYETTALSLSSSIQHLFSTLYGMFPCNTFDSCQKHFDELLIHAMQPSQLMTGFEIWHDPQILARQTAFSSSNIALRDLVKSRAEVCSNFAHPSFLAFIEIALHSSQPPIPFSGPRNETSLV